jgi:hypothetical protein
VTACWAWLDGATMETAAIAAAKNAVLGVQSIASSRDRVFWLCRYYAGLDPCPWVRARGGS